MIGIGLGLNRLRSSGSLLAAYAANGFTPTLGYDFVNGVYAVDSAATTVNFERSGAAMMVDSDGILKWSPHNLAVNSATPATQSITVVSGADYTVECTGAGSITLSGAGTGSVTAGSPVEVTASTTTLTLTVVGSLDTMWAYRSDLGGMVNNPETGNSYVPTTTTARYLPRIGSHVYDGSTWVNEGLLFEEAGTNLLLNSGTLSTQNVTVAAEPHTLSFTGTGTVTLTGTSTAGPLVGTGTGEENRVNLTFTPTAGTLTLTVSGTVTNAQLEESSIPTSYIPTTGAQAARTADTWTIPAADMPWNASGVSIHMAGLLSYADNNETTAVIFTDWYVDTANYLRMGLTTGGALPSTTGSIDFVQRTAAVTDRTLSGGDSLSPGIGVPFSVAVRHTPTAINGALNGVSATENDTPIALADVSGADFEVVPTFNGYISQLLVWADDIGDAGIEEATS